MHWSPRSGQSKLAPGVSLSSPNSSKILSIPRRNSAKLRARTILPCFDFLNSPCPRPLPISNFVSRLFPRQKAGLPCRPPASNLPTRSSPPTTSSPTAQPRSTPTPRSQRQTKSRSSSRSQSRVSIRPSCLSPMCSPRPPSTPSPPRASSSCTAWAIPEASNARSRSLPSPMP